VTTTVQQLAARQTRQAADVIIAAANSTHPDKVTWQPLDQGRTVLNQVIECGMANLKWANILRSFTYSNLPPDLRASFDVIDTLPEATARVDATAQELADVLLAVPDERLETEIETPWGPYNVAEACLHAYWNMVYHEGQINYIQTLYGDTEEH
jgi:hypothetical protein